MSAAGVVDGGERPTVNRAGLLPKDAKAPSLASPEGLSYER